MHISMWTLSKHLSAYYPQINIIDGDRILQNVRLFSDDVKMSRSTVYLSLTEDKVLCISGHDMLVLETTDINQVFNDILDTFDYYNEWSYGIEQAIMSGCTAYELLRLGSAVLDYYLLIGDATFLVREQYCSDRYLNIFPYVKELLPVKVLPMDTLMAINSLGFVRQQGIRPYNLPFVDDRHRTAARNIFVDNSHKGWIVAVRENDRVFDEAELDLLDELGDRLEQWMRNNQSAEERMEISGIFLSLLDKDPRKIETDERKQITQRLTVLGWHEADQIQIYVLRQQNTTVQNWSVVDGYFRSMHGGCVAFSHQEFLVLAVNYALADRDELEDDIRYLLKRYGYLAAKCPVFSDITLFKEYYYAARTALIHGAKGGDICDFTELVLPYMLSLIQEHAVADVCHPCLRILRQYDKEHGTQLYQTLYVFLQCERNHTAVAERLTIHRSTLIYRINRISDLTGVDFEDNIQRFYVLLSFMIEANKERE